MANTNAPFGFSQYFGGSGGVPTFNQSVRRIASANSTPIYTGDPVMPVISNKLITHARAKRCDVVFMHGWYMRSR